MLLSLLSIGLTVYLVVAAFAFMFADRMIFLPPRVTYRADQMPITQVRSGSDSVALLYLPNSSARYTILYSHGNAEDLGGVSFLLHELHALGFSVIGYDYRGYGMSTGGPPTAAKAKGDAEAVYDYAVNDLGIPPERLIVHGRSVGTGPAMELAGTRPVGGVILESPFTSTFRVLTRIRLLPFDRFPNLAHMRNVRAPVLVIHGKQDEVIPFAHGMRLFEAAPEPKQSLWVAEAGHNDLLETAGPKYASALRSFARLLDSR